MNLVEQVRKQLESRLKANNIAYGKLWEIRKEVEALAKLSGFFEPFHDGFNYYAPDGSGRNRLLIKCYVEGDATRLVYITGPSAEDEDKHTVTYEPLEKILDGLSYAISFRLARQGIYKI